MSGWLVTGWCHSESTKSALCVNVVPRITLERYYYNQKNNIPFSDSLSVAYNFERLISQRIQNLQDGSPWLTNRNRAPILQNGRGKSENLGFHGLSTLKSSITRVSLYDELSLHDYLLIKYSILLSLQLDQLQFYL